MTALTGLKLTAAQKPTQMSPIQQRRNKLAKRLWEQMELAKAQQTGGTFAPTKFRSVVQNDTGQRKQIEVAKRIKQWWFVADNGKLVLSVRYGTKVLELAKGKWAVEVGSDKDLVPTLELLKGAVLDGELDAQIEAASNKLREGFGG
jgi:ABC-type phosphate/phosphonate transport system ATPase subunit